ncbi:MAG: glycosyltransferase family 39 protein [Thermoanaerobaculia bacterium]
MPWSATLKARLQADKLGLALGLFLAGCVVAWLATCLGHPPPLAFSRLLVAAAVIACAWQGARALARLLRGQEALPASEARWLVALGALAAAVYWTGLGHELGGLYFADEGIFLAQAQRINRGQLLRPWFVYPHLLFYLDAFALWLASLFQGPVAAFAQRVFGLAEPQLVSALVTRFVSGTFGAATVLPVFFLARRLAGLPAAVLGGALMVFSSIYLEVAHLNLGDGLSAFLATLCLAVAARLLDCESWGGYLGAGLLAGLAAGAKYPAGVVAVAIFGLYLRHRWRERGFRTALARGGLALAAVAAVAGLLLTTPSLAAFPGAASGSGTAADLFFGARLYAQHGWPGVVRENNAAYYAGELVHGFGLPALLLGVAGLALVPAATRSRVAWMLPFPVAYGALLLLLKIALRRNLMPALPILAVLLGVGLASLAARLGGGSPGRLKVALGALAAASLAVPIRTSALQLVGYVYPTTRQQAASWMARKLPPGSYIVQEQYTPNLAGVRHFFTRQPRLAIKLPLAEIRRPEHDYLLLASESYNRFLRPDKAEDPALAAPAARYRELFATFPLVAEFEPDSLHSGPELRLYQVDPPQPAWTAVPVTFAASDAWLATETMRAAGEARVHYHEEGQWALFKPYLEAGRYRLTLEGAEARAPGSFTVRSREAGILSEGEIRPDRPAEFELAKPAKTFLYVRLPIGGSFAALRVEKSPG